MFSWIWSRHKPPRGEVPVFVEVLQGQRVKHASPVVLQARLTGHPPPQVIWYHGSKEIPNSPDFKQEYDTESGRIKLTIEEVFVDDQGPYRAVAINEYGKDETTAFVGLEDIEVLQKSELRQAPRVTLPLKASVITAHGSVEMMAQFEAFPPPTIKWYKQGKEIKPSSEYIIIYGDNETRLHLTEVYEDDSGEFEVRIFNDAGEARTAASLVVVKPEEKIEMEPPQFTKPLAPQTVPEGEVAILDVEVKAKPNATFAWFRHGIKIMDDEELEVSITSDENKSRLVIGEVFEDDSGDYTVTAENDVGKASSTATLLVEGEGAQEAVAPEFNPPLTPIRVMDGQQVRFACRVTGTPTPQISWFHAGRPIGHHREVKVLQSQDGKVGLVISEVFPEDSGDYTCVARNKAGEARTTATLLVEAYEYTPDSEVATVTSVSEKTLLSGSVTEDETLEIDKDSSSDSDLSEIGSAPEFVESLPTIVKVEEGKPTRLLAKVIGYPRPSVTWLADGTAVKASEGLTLENYEDGTVSLSLPWAMTDQCGDYTCEAQNRNGVATCATQLVVLPQEHNETSASYRKPDWVTRMEELKTTMQAEHVEPQFTQELVNGRVKEMENYVFTVAFAGNPKPEISWYHDNLLLHQHQAFQMRVRGDKAFLSIVEASPKHKGEYVCRAVNSAGECLTKATLEVIELTYEEKLKIANERYAALSIQHAAEHMKVKERERSEREKIAHKEAMEKMREDRHRAIIEKERELEEAKLNTWKPQRRVSEIQVKKVEPQTPKEHRIAQVYTNWKAPVALEEAYPEIEPQEFSPNQIPGVKCFVKVSDTSIRGEEVVKEIAPKFFEDEQVVIELAKVHTLLRNSVRVNEIWSMFRAGEFPALQQPSIQTALVKICEYIGHQRNVSIVLAEETRIQAAQHPVGLKAFLRMLKHANNVKHDVLFKEVIPKEMGKWSSTTQELEKVSQMLNQGMVSEEIIASCEAGHLPTLKKPETQQPLVNIVEKQGHSVMVAQVLVEEAYRDAKEDRVLAEHAWQVLHEEELAHAAVVQVKEEALVVDKETHTSQYVTQETQQTLFIDEQRELETRELQPYRTQPLAQPRTETQITTKIVAQGAETQPLDTYATQQDVDFDDYSTDEQSLSEQLSSSTDIVQTKDVTIEKSQPVKKRQVKRVTKKIIRRPKSVDKVALKPVEAIKTISEVETEHVTLKPVTRVESEESLLQITDRDASAKLVSSQMFFEQSDHTQLEIDSDTQLSTLQKLQDISDSKIIRTQEDESEIKLIKPKPIALETSKTTETVTKVEKVSVKPKPQTQLVETEQVTLKPVVQKTVRTSEKQQVEHVDLKPTQPKEIKQETLSEPVKLKPLAKIDVVKVPEPKPVDLKPLTKVTSTKPIPEAAKVTLRPTIPESPVLEPQPEEVTLEPMTLVEPEPAPQPEPVTLTPVVKQEVAPESPGTKRKIIKKKIIVKKPKPELEQAPEQIKFKSPKQHELRPDDEAEQVVLKPFTIPSQPAPKPEPVAPVEQEPLPKVKPVVIPEREEVVLEAYKPTPIKQLPLEEPKPEPVQLKPIPKPAPVEPVPEPEPVKRKPIKKVPKEEPQPETVQFKARQRPASPEPEPEEVRLKPIPKAPKPEPEVAPVELKPIQKPKPLEPIPEPEAPKLKKVKKVIKPKPEPEPEEVSLKPVQRPVKEDEPVPEPIQLKPIEKKEKPVPEPEEPKLKPIQKPAKVEPEPEAIKLKPRQKPAEPEPEPEPIKLKPIPKPSKPEPEPEPIRLKPIQKPIEPVPDREPVQLKPIPKREVPEPKLEPVQLQPIQKPVKPEPEPEPVVLKPIPKPEKVKPEPEPEPEPVKFKRVQKPVEPEPEPEPIKLKPIQKPDKPEPEPEPIKLKPIQKPDKPEPAPEPIKLKPIQKPAKPEPEPEPIKLKPVQKPAKPEPEPEPIKLKPVKKTEKPLPEPEPISLKPTLKPIKEKEIEPEAPKLKPGKPLKPKPEPEPEKITLKPVQKPSKPEPVPQPVTPKLEPGKPDTYEPETEPITSSIVKQFEEVVKETEQVTQKPYEIDNTETVTTTVTEVRKIEYEPLKPILTQKESYTDEIILQTTPQAQTEIKELTIVSETKPEEPKHVVQQTEEVIIEQTVPVSTSRIVEDTAKQVTQQDFYQTTQQTHHVQMVQESSTQMQFQKVEEHQIATPMTEQVQQTMIEEVPKSRIEVTQTVAKISPQPSPVFEKESGFVEQKVSTQDVIVTKEVRQYEQVDVQHPQVIMREMQTVTTMQPEVVQTVTQQVITGQATSAQQEQTMKSVTVQQTSVTQEATKSPTVVRKVKKIIKKPKTTVTVQEVQEFPEVEDVTIVKKTVVHQPEVVVKQQEQVVEAHAQFSQKQEVVQQQQTVVHEQHQVVQQRKQSVQKTVVQQQEQVSTQKVEKQVVQEEVIQQEVTLPALVPRVASAVEEEAAEGSVETFEIAPIEMTSVKPQDVPDSLTQSAHVSQVITEMCVPGFKAIFRIAQENKLDLETMELQPFEKTELHKDLAKLNFQVKRGAQVQELMTMMKEGEFPALKAPEMQASILEVASRHEKATVTQVLIQEASYRKDKSIGAKSILKSIETGKETLEEVLMDVSKEFGPQSAPVKEVAAVGQLLNEGVRCDEVVTMIEAGLLPGLQSPQAQMPLVSMVTNRGHTGVVCEVLVTESTKEIPKMTPAAKTAQISEYRGMLTKAKASSTDVKTFTKEMAPGLKAYVQMAQEETVVIDEVVEKSNMTTQFKKEMAKVGMMVKQGILAEEVLTLLEAGEFPELMKMEAQAQLLNVVEECGFHAIVNKVTIDEAVQQSEKAIGVKAFVKMMKEAKVNMEEILTESLPKEFGPDDKEPVREMARVSVMMKEGVQAEEIITMMEANQLPSLKKPESQAPLLKVVEQQGQSALVCQVLIEESVKDIKQGLPKVDVAAVSSVPSLKTASSAQVVVKEDTQVNVSSTITIEAVSAQDVKVGDQLRAIATYVAEEEHENSMHLVEGERVYVLESINSDWWFVEKHLTKERGYVPAKLLAVEASYTLYVKRKLEEKISKLNVFEKLKKGQKAESPKITQTLESQTIVDGQEVQFVVKVEGTPRPNVTWFRQTAIIKPSEEFQVFYSEDNTATLVIKEVFPEDAGLFTCVVKNLAGYAISEAELIVEGPVSDHGSETTVFSRRSLSRDSSVCDVMEGIPPTFAMKSITKTCEENAQFEVDVRLVAIPEPEIVWKKGGLILRDSNRIRIVRQKDVHAYRSIILIKGTKKDDEGEYEVCCKNREGEAKCNIFLKITAPEAPLFEEKFSDTTVEEDGTIRLVARIRGVPTPDIAWSRNGKKITLSKTVIARYEEETAVLEVQHASSKNDAGKYVCTATNKVGKASHSANVTVGSDVVTFKRGLESCVVEENAEAVLECRTSREKEVKWWKGKMELKSNERILIEQEGLTHRIVIHSSAVSDTGKYKCTFDDQSTWCNFTVKPLEEFVQKLQDFEVQEKDEAVFYVEVSTEKAVITWHKDGEEIRGDDRIKVEVDGKIRRLVILSTNLHDEGEYTCVLGDLESTCELTVRELPAEIVKDMEDQTVNKAEKASFAVELSKGDAVVTWFKDGQEIRFSDHYQLSIDGKVQRLLIYNCQTEDIGVYRAVVGKTECSAKLEVEAQAEGDFTKKLASQMDVISNTDAEFTVEITKADRDVKWLRNGEEVSASARFIIKKKNNVRTLTIKSVTIEDTAEYTCVLGSLKTSCKMNVLVLESAPTVDRSSIQTEFVVIKGTDVTFTVPFKATPQPTATWSHKGKEIKQSKRLMPTISENVASFTIYQVENIDCGEYCLKLANSCGDVSIDFVLKILDKPSRPGAPEALRVTNDSVTLHWRAPEDDGGRIIINYIIEYTFRKEIKWVVYNSSETISETTVTVTRLTKDEEYSFRVAAVNEVGTSEYSEQSEYIKVAEPIRPEAPMVKEFLEPVVTGLRQLVVLRCVITGTPVPDITWTKDEKVITSNTTYENYTATLTIKETDCTTSGMYTCKASNSAGSAETSATVVIQEAPQFEFDEKSQAQRLFVGERWHVPIKVTGFPQPKISWTCNDQPIKNFPRVVVHIEESEGLTDIAIQKLAFEDSAVFAITAQNSAGRATISFNLRVDEEEIIVKEVEKERPAAPAGPLDITDITTCSARLTWRPSPHDGGSEITSYYIEKLEKGQKQWHKVAEVEPTIFSYVVENLNEGREYFFRVFALNAIGLSEALEATETIFIKSPFNPPGPPLGPFDVTDMAETSLVLHWDEPLEDGGSPITGYTIERRTAMKKAWQKIGQTEGDVTKFECTNLKKGYTYFFRVFAVNVAGQGPPLQPDEAITAGKKLSVPSKPNGLTVIDVTSKTVTLGWSPPSTTGGADLIGYVIEKRLTIESASWEKVQTVDSSVTLYCVENLLEKSEYEFRVFAENPVGLSEEAAITEYVQLKTHATPPSPPTAPLEARPTGPTSLMIEWGAPESDGGSPLLGYIIAIRDIKRTMWIEVGQVDANFTRLHIKEVQEEHEYNVRVFARNEIGASDPLQTEDPVKIIRPDDFQEVPEEDAAPSLSYSTTETLSWMREAGVDADIYSYARGRLLNRDEYFFKVWHQTQQIRKEEEEERGGGGDK